MIEPRTATEARQKEHFDEIMSEYERHYDDPCSRKYREAFMLRPMTDGLDLSGVHVLEGMCGTGQATEYLLSKGARVTGLDISEEGIRRFKKRWPKCQAVCASMLDSK